MEEHLYHRDLLYAPESLDHLLEADMKRKVTVDQIGVPVIVFSMYDSLLDQLSNLSIFRASQEEIGRRLCHNSFHSIRMRSIDPCVCISVTQIVHASVHVLEPLPTSGGCHVRPRRQPSRPPTVLNIKDPHFSISSCRDEGAVIGVWHEFDGEYIGSMARSNGSSKGKGSNCGVWLVCVDIEMLVIAAGSQQFPRCRPTGSAMSVPSFLLLEQATRSDLP